MVDQTKLQERKDRLSSQKMRMWRQAFKGKRNRGMMRQLTDLIEDTYNINKTLDPSNNRSRKIAGWTWD